MLQPMTSAGWEDSSLPDLITSGYPRNKYELQLDMDGIPHEMNWESIGHKDTKIYRCGFLMVDPKTSQNHWDFPPKIIGSSYENMAMSG